MTRFSLSFLALIFSVTAFAEVDLQKEALKYVPKGQVKAVEKDEVIIHTAAGTPIEIEINRDGTLDEASGHSATKDVFVPGNGLMSLSDALAALQKQGKKAEGEWSLEKDFLRDWEYEFEGYENNQKFEYVVNAKNGKLLKSKKD